MSNSFIENVNYVAKLDNAFGDNISLNKTNISFRGTTANVKFKLSYYDNSLMKILSVETLFNNASYTDLNSILSQFKSNVENIIGVNCNFTLSTNNNAYLVSLVNISLSSSNNDIKFVELKFEMEKDGIDLYDVYGKITNPLKILPHLALYDEILISSIVSIDSHKNELLNVNTNISEIVAINDNIEYVISVNNNMNNINTILSNMDTIENVISSINEINNINTNIGQIHTVYENIDSILIDANNISNINNVSDNINSIININNSIVPNINEILLADDNAIIATTKASEASASEASALSSKNSASASEANAFSYMNSAFQYKNNALASSNNALLSEQNAASSEANASNSEFNASVSESNALTYRNETEVMKLAVETIYDIFDDRFLGVFNYDPVLDNDGNALISGALYFNPTSHEMKVYDVGTTTWYSLPKVYLSTLLDVELTSVSTNNVLIWNGTKWINSNLKTINGLSLIGTGDLSISTGGGYAANVYLTTVASSTNGSYSQLSYAPEATETILSATVNNNTVLIEDYIFDGDVQAQFIPAGEWGFHFHRKVDNTAADTKIIFEIYKRSNLGIETVLFTVSSASIEDTTFAREDLLIAKPSFVVDTTDRIGLKIYATTRNSNVTVQLKVGDGEACYFNTPLAVRHNQLRARDDVDSHPISAITGLQSELDNKLGISANAVSATKLATIRTISLTGDVTGSVTFDGTANAAITATIAANSVTLGTDTTGNYVSSLTQGTGITVSGTAGEGWSPTISITNVGTSGTYTKVTTNAQGQVTSGTTLSSTDIPSLDTEKLTTGTLPVARGGTGTTTSTGSGSVVLSTSPVLTTPNIGVATGASFNSITGLASVAPLVAGTSSVGTSTLAARQDHVHPVQTSVSGNAGTATTLQTARTISLSGDVTGSVSFNGSSNVDIVSTVADNSHNHTIANVTGLQTALDNKVDDSEKGSANGVATLDSNGKVVLTQIPDSVLGQLKYQGVWNFTTLPTATQKGQYWIASVSGNGYDVGDWAIWNGTAFDKVDNTDAVASVAGRTGNVVLTKSDVGLNLVDNTADSEKNVLSATKLKTARTIALTGDVTYTSGAFDGSGNVTGTATLANSGVTAGTYKSVTVDSKGRVTGGTNPNTIALYGITDAYTKTEIGAINTDYVAVFNAALV